MHTPACRVWPRSAFSLLVLCLLGALRGRAAGGTSVGDWGHFLSYRPKVFLHNPGGEAFTVSIHAMRWALEAWNHGSAAVRITGPDGRILAEGDHALTNADCSFSLPAGPKGIYLVEPSGNVWIESSLARSVLWTGDPRGHAIEGRRAVWQAVVPRRWWFWVPADSTGFVCRAQRADRYMSQREDWGIFIGTPRGQRIRALWGQPEHTPARDYRRDQEVSVEVEPGTAGRFWYADVRLGDSHNYSKVNLALEGVPPYLARSPEEWFNPDQGGPPAVPMYDATPFIQSARLEGVMTARWPNLQHFSPCPSLGDPDGVQVLGDAAFALWNPDGRELGFRIGTYLPRGGERSPAPETARVRIEESNSAVLLDKELPLLHIHHAAGHPTDTLQSGPGVLRARVSGAERWMAFTYPATPLVLVGRDEEGGWRRFRLTAGTVRNWYFRVPHGVRQFAVRAAAEAETDVMSLEVNAPDRTMALFYDRQAERTITVPEGLDGKVWFLRPDVGSATRMVTTRDRGERYQELNLTVDLKGVPGCLSPTWEQWFDPEQPRAPLDRTP